MAGLPAPQYEYQIALPDVGDGGVDGEEALLEEDAADAAARRRAEAKAREQAALRKRSQAGIMATMLAVYYMYLPKQHLLEMQLQVVISQH